LQGTKNYYIFAELFQEARGKSQEVRQKTKVKGILLNDINQSINQSKKLSNIQTFNI
jgi:hypothetical protein